PGLLCVHLVVSQQVSSGSAWSHWLVRSHLQGDLADAVKSAVQRSAPRGYDALDVEHVSTPLPLEDVWLEAAEESTATLGWS
ncbi:unnamed protein product, partial [Effrenium voratum]